MEACLGVLQCSISCLVSYRGLHCQFTIRQVCNLGHGWIYGMPRPQKPRNRKRKRGSDSDCTFIYDLLCQLTSCSFLKNRAHVG